MIAKVGPKPSVVPLGKFLAMVMTQKAFLAALVGGLFG